MAIEAAQAKRVLLVSMVGTGSYVVISRAMHGQWPSDPRLWISLGVVYVILGFSADFVPGLVAPFAVLILLGLLISDQGQVFSGLTALGQGKIGNKTPVRVVPAQSGQAGGTAKKKG